MSWVRVGAHIINQDHIVRFSDVSCSGDGAKPRTSVELSTGKVLILDMSREDFGRAAGMVFPGDVPEPEIVDRSSYFYGRN
jgi:hypothetical protein